MTFLREVFNEEKLPRKVTFPLLGGLIKLWIYASCIKTSHQALKALKISTPPGGRQAMKAFKAFIMSMAVIVFLGFLAEGNDLSSFAYAGF